MSFGLSIIGGDMTKLNTVYELESIEGDKIKLTLTYRYLLQLKRKHPEDYREYNRIMTKGADDEFDNIQILYTAYLCEKIAEDGDTGNAMPFDDFIDILPFDRVEIAKAVGMLIAPKKTMASADLS